jgi:hypothetical protein
MLLQRLMLSLYMFTGSALLAFSVPVFSQQPPKHIDNNLDQNQISILVDNGLLSARFHDQPLHIVCQKIAEKTKIRVVLAEGLAEDLVTLTASSEAIDVSLRNLFTNYDTFVFYGSPKNGPSGLRSVWVYPKGEASDLRPVPRSDWAGVRELEATLGDTNADVREAAYITLLGRADSRSRRLVIDAITGVRERDPLLRVRLLSTATNKGFGLPSDVLADLARTDASEQIRWVALDALAFSDYPSARQVAEAAATDASEAVRSRANEMLNQLSRERREQHAQTETKAADPGR